MSHCRLNNKEQYENKSEVVRFTIIDMDLRESFHTNFGIEAKVLI